MPLHRNWINTYFLISLGTCRDVVCIRGCKNESLRENTAQHNTTGFLLALSFRVLRSTFDRFQCAAEVRYAQNPTCEIGFQRRKEAQHLARVDDVVGCGLGVSIHLPVKHTLFRPPLLPHIQHCSRNVTPSVIEAPPPKKAPVEYQLINRSRGKAV